jgi:cyclic pyranopterin phosphate synthase
MVDVSTKPLSSRTAVASGKISLQKQTADLIAKNKIAKGNVIATARIAGIQAAKQTAHLVPLCHTIPLSHVKVDIEVFDDGAEARCSARTIAQTGVEMEALTGVAVALLTIYDMCKAVDRKCHGVIWLKSKRSPRIWKRVMGEVNTSTPILQHSLDRSGISPNNAPDWAV